MAEMTQQPQQLDTLYQGYSRGLYKITGEEGYDSIMDIMQADSTASTSGSVTVPADSVDSGVSTSTSNQASGAATQQGKSTFDNSTEGYILGTDPSTGNAKFYIGDSNTYLNWNGDTGVLTVKGSISASSIDIPNTTTASSMHVDSSGNTWWGATTLAGSTASVTAAGVATFAGLAVINKKSYTNFETAGRFITSSGGTGAVTFGNQGVTIDTGSTAAAFARVIWYIANVYTNNPTFVCTLVVNHAPPGTGEAFIGMGQPSVSGAGGHTFTSTSILGFQIINVVGSSTLSIRGISNDGSTNPVTTNYFALTVTTGDVLELFVHSLGTSANFYIRKNGSALSAPLTIASQIPTGAGETSVQFSVSNVNVANQTQFILQGAGYEH